MRPTEQLRANARIAAFAGTCVAALGAYETALWLTPVQSRDEMLLNAKRMVATHVLRSLGVTASVRGAPPTSQRAQLIVANHRAALDVGVILTQLPGYFLSRADLANWPVVGQLAKHAGTLFVDRDSGHSGASAIRGIRRLLKDGRSVIVFPEGTTHRGDAVRPFRPGAFAAVRGLDVEIVPVGLAYPAGVEYVDVDFMTHVKRVAARPTTRVCVEVGAPFRPGGRTRAIAAESEARVAALVVDARKRFEREA